SFNGRQKISRLIGGSLQNPVFVIEFTYRWKVGGNNGLTDSQIFINLGRDYSRGVKTIHIGNDADVESPYVGEQIVMRLLTKQMYVGQLLQFTDSSLNRAYENPRPLSSGARHFY